MDAVGAVTGGMNLGLMPTPHGWGIDNLWCGAALTYATSVLRQPARPFCVLLPLAVGHRDTREAPRSLGASEAGHRAIGLSCLLSRAAAAQMTFAAAAMSNGTAVAAATPWVVSPKALGYQAGGDGSYNASHGLQRSLRRVLLARASYEVRRTCTR